MKPGKTLLSIIFELFETLICFEYMKEIVIIKHKRRGLFYIDAEKWNKSKDHYIRDGWTLANESDAEKYMTKNFDEEE